MSFHDIVVIGGSMGSTSALKQMLADLPADLPASVFVCTHLPPGGSNLLAHILEGVSALPVVAAVDGQPVLPGRVTVGVPDRHMLLIDHALVLGSGPRENMVRPSIDPLFRSAALGFGARVVGVVLSGLLNDGVSGLHAIKERGGLAVVQHPLDAEADEMPLAALEAVEADEVAPAADLGKLINQLVLTEPGPDQPSRTDLDLEVHIALGRRLGSERLREVAIPSTLTCPHCHGVLSEMKHQGPLRFRCQIGHAFTAETVLAAQEGGVDDALRVALRMMEERLELVTRMARDARQTGRHAVAELYDARAREYEGYAVTLRRAAQLSLRMHHRTENDPV